MKAKLYLILAVVACMMYNCSQEEVMEQPQKVTNTLTASIDGSSRSTVTDAGIFSWTAGYQISVWNGSNFVRYSNTSGNNFTTTENNPGTPQMYAVYPAGTHTYEYSDLTVNLPDVYDYSEQNEYEPNTNAPMLASFAEGEDIVFKHLGGLMRFIVKNVPAGANEFVFTSDKDITGAFLVNLAENSISAESISTENTVTIKFKTLTAQKDKMIFYVPLPVDTYTGYTVAIKGTNDLNLENTSPGVSNKVVRRSLLLMPEFTCNTMTYKLDKATATNVTPSASGETAPVTGGTVSIANPSESDAKATINFTPTDNNAILNIVDASSADTPQESNATVGVVVEEGANVPVLNIDAPTTTVELSTANGTATYETVTALTATSTLKVKTGITIKRLILKGGNVEVDEGATIESIEDESADGTDPILVGTTGYVSCLGELTNAIENNAITRIVLTKNITDSGILMIRRAVTLDLNGKTLSGTANRLIRIANESAVADFKVTIKNGTISNGLSGGRCVETRSGNIGLTLDGVKLETTGGGNPQNFTVGGSGNNVTVLIKNSIIKGARAAYGIITFNPVIMTIENSTVEAYAAIYAKPADGSLGSAGSCFDVENSTLIGKNVETSHQENSFGTVVLEADSITVNVDAQSTLKAATVNPNVHAIFRFNASVSGTRITVDTANMELSGDKSYTFVPCDGMGTDNILLFPASWKDRLDFEGFETVSENGYVKIAAIQ